MWVEGSHVVVSAPMLGGVIGIYLAIAFLPSLVVLIALLTTHRLRVTERASRRQVRLQAWQLGQLVPSPRDAAG
jgi:hypothetical protein